MRKLVETPLRSNPFLLLLFVIPLVYLLDPDPVFLGKTPNTFWLLLQVLVIFPTGILFLLQGLTFPFLCGILRYGKR